MKSNGIFTDNAKWSSRWKIHNQKPIRMVGKDPRKNMMTDIDLFVDEQPHVHYANIVIQLVKNCWGDCKNIQHIHTKIVEDFIYKEWMCDRGIYQAAERTRNFLGGSDEGY